MAACLVSCACSREVRHPSCFLTLHDLDVRGQEDGLAAYGWGAACHTVTVVHAHRLWTCFCPLPGRSGLAALSASQASGVVEGCHLSVQMSRGGAVWSRWLCDREGWQGRGVGVGGGGRICERTQAGPRMSSTASPGMWAWEEQRLR